MKGIGFLSRTAIVSKRIPFVRGEVSQKVFAIIGEVGKDKMEDPT